MCHLHFLLELLLSRLYLYHSAFQFAFADKKSFVERCLRQNDLCQMPRQSFCLISIQACSTSQCKSWSAQLSSTQFGMKVMTSTLCLHACACSDCASGQSRQHVTALRCRFNHGGPWSGTVPCALFQEWWKDMRLTGFTPCCSNCLHAESASVSMPWSKLHEAPPVSHRCMPIIRAQTQIRSECGAVHLQRQHRSCDAQVIKCRLETSDPDVQARTSSSATYQQAALLPRCSACPLAETMLT
jgi:hypothetical protein